MPGHRDWYKLTAGTPEDFKIAFDPYPFHEMSISAAGAYTANLIQEKHNNIWLAMSGGYDSEFVANCFYDNNIPFTPIIWRIQDWPESDYAIHWCRQRNITPHIVDKDLLTGPTLSFLQKTAARMHTDHFLCTVNIVLSSIAEKQGGFLVTGTGVPTPDPDYPIPMGDHTEFSEHDFFMEILKDHHPGSFLMYTVELFYALLKKTDITLPTQEAKSAIYGVNFRPKLKPYHLLAKQTEMFVDKAHEYSTGTFQDLIDQLEKSLVFSSTKYPIPNGQK